MDKLTAKPGQPGEKDQYDQELTYYQWVPIILSFLAATFFVPGRFAVVSAPHLVTCHVGTTLAHLCDF